MTNFQTNTQQFNQDSLYISQDIDGVVVFGDINLMSLCEDGNYGIIVQSMNLYDLDNIEVSSYESGVYDGGGVYGVRYATRLLSLRLFIQEANHSNLIKTFDNIKKKTAQQDYITIKWKGYNDTKRRQRAVLRGLEFGSIGDQDYATDVQMDILLLDGYWSEVEDIQKLITSVTGTTVNIITNHGAYESYPRIVMTLGSSGNAITGIDIEIRKLGETSGFTLSIFETIEDNDVLIFDYKEKQVLLNNVSIPYYGPMTPLEIGSNEVVITPTGTINGTINISYFKTWL